MTLMAPPVPSLASFPTREPYPAHYRGCYQLPSLRGHDAEDREEYQTGGFHPVELGATFGDGERYRVVHKLGKGGSATVWLTRDRVSERYVALKIMMAERSDEDLGRELRCFEWLRAAGSSHPGAKYVTMPLDKFRFQGPNGSHLCLVSHVLGPRISDVDFIRTFSGQAKREAARQATEALAFLHAVGIGHGDFKPSNILVQPVDLDALTQEELYEQLGRPELDPVVTASGGRPGPEAPPYVVCPANLSLLDSRWLKKQIERIDFGEAYALNNPPRDIGTPAGYRFPELLFDNRIGMAADLWALACSIYQIRTGRALFQMFFGDDDEVIEQFVQLLGKLPSPWWERWGARGQLFDDNGWPKVNPETGEPVAYTFSFQQMIKRESPLPSGPEGIDVISSEEVESLADLLRKLLTYRPEDRITVGEALNHPLFHQTFLP